MKQSARSSLFISVFFFLGASAQVYNEDYSKSQRYNLYKNNKVWMVYGWTYQYSKGVQEKKGKKTSFERFDKEGNRTEEIYYDTKGKPNYSCQYLFDDKGNEVKKMGDAADEVIYEKWQYAFSENGKKAERKSEYKQANNQKWIYTFNTQENKSEEICYDVNGVISYKWEFLYDENQNITEKQQLDEYGNINQKWSYKYDGKGNNIELKHYVANNQLHRIYGMRYDKKGNMKSKFTFDKDENVLELTVYIYQFYDGLHAPRTTGNKK